MILGIFLYAGKAFNYVIIEGKKEKTFLKLNFI